MLPSLLIPIYRYENSNNGAAFSYKDIWTSYQVVYSEWFPHIPILPHALSNDPILTFKAKFSV